MAKFNKTARAAPWLLCLTLVIATPFAHGTILNNGDTGPPSFIFPGGTLMAEKSGTITTDTFSTSFTTWVYSDPNNTFCVGCLDFVYQFKNNGPDVNERFTMFNFEPFKVNAGYDPSTPGLPPLTVGRAVNGEVVSFNYNGAGTLEPGKGTPLLVIEVNATKFTSGFVTAQDGTAGFAAAFAPNGAIIPEPSSLGLLGGGLLFVGGFLRKFWLIRKN